MKNLQHLFLVAVLFLGALSVKAQPGGGMECDCPEPTPEDIVCVSLDENNIVAFPSACLAECLGFTVVEGDCNSNGGGDPVDPFDCDCPEPTDNDFICATDEFGNIMPFPNACIAECLGFQITDCGDTFPGGGGNPVDCDCPDPAGNELICAVDANGAIMVFPTECIALCLGFEVVDCGDTFPGGGGDPGDCDCPEPTENDGVCVVDEFGTELFFPSLCIAECLGLQVIECGDGFPGGGDPWGCDCPDPTFNEFVCAVDAEGVLMTFPSTCIAACLGFEVVDCGDTFPGGGEPVECNCPEPTEADTVCAADAFGNIYPFPSACYATCLGFTVVEGDCNIDLPGDNCDCPEPTADDIVTITFEDGTEFCFPSLCIAECLGFLGDGLLPGDVFGTLSYEVALNGDNVFGGTIEELEVYPNPVEDMLYLSIKANGNGATSVKLFSLTGQVIFEEQVGINSGTQRIELPLNNLPSGSYILGVADGSGKLVTKNLVKTN